MALQGARQLRSRLDAFNKVFHPVGEEWGERAVELAQSRVAVDTGETRASIRRSNNPLSTKSSVEAGGAAVFLETGTRPHPITPVRVGVLRFSKNGQPMFRRRTNHPGIQQQPFFYDSASEAVQKVDILGNLIDLWNRAA